MQGPLASRNAHGQLHHHVGLGFRILTSVPNCLDFSQGLVKRKEAHTRNLKMNKIILPSATPPTPRNKVVSVFSSLSPLSKS